MKRALFLAFAAFLLAAPRIMAAPSAPDDGEKEGTIVGMAIKRLDHDGWLGLRINEGDGTFRLTFYNNKKKPEPADRTSAVLRWSVHYQPNPERTELVPTDDPAVFGSPYPIKPPHSFKLHIVLLPAEGDKEPESYVVDFNG